MPPRDDAVVQRCPDCNRPLGGKLSEPHEGLQYVCLDCEKKVPIECRYCGDSTLPDLEGTARCTDCDVTVFAGRKRLRWSGEPASKVHWDNWGVFRYRMRRRFTEIERSLRHAAATSTVLDAEWDRYLPFDEVALSRAVLTVAATVGGLVFLGVHPGWFVLAFFGALFVWAILEWLARRLASKRWPATKVRVDAKTIDVERGKRRRLFVRVDTEVSVQDEGIVLKDAEGSVRLPAYSRDAAEWLAERIAGVPLSREEEAGPGSDRA